MDKRSELAYDIGFGILGLAMGVAAAFAAIAHLHLGQIDEATSESVMIFFENYERERDRWETIRVVSSFAFVGTAILLIAGSKGYYEQKENPIWEVKKGIGSGAVLLFLGAGLYLLGPDVIMKGVGLGMAVLGLLNAGFGTVLLFYFDESKPSGSSTGPYCPDCGSNVSDSASYCDSCGSSL